MINNGQIIQLKSVEEGGSEQDLIEHISKSDHSMKDHTRLAIHVSDVW